MTKLNHFILQTYYNFQVKTAFQKDSKFKQLLNMHVPIIDSNYT